MNKEQSSLERIPHGSFEEDEEDEDVQFIKTQRSEILMYFFNCCFFFCSCIWWV